jgi:cytochrome c5
MKLQIFAGCVALGSALLVAAPVLAVQDRAAHQAAHGSTAQHQASAQHQTPEEEGQRVFDRNCARCHNSPNGFSPRITGTIVRHMRVRANLSEHDEKVLLRFLQ